MNFWAKNFKNLSSDDDNVIEIDGFNKKSGSYILKYSNIDHKEETIQARSHDFRKKLKKFRVHALYENILYRLRNL